MNHDDVTVVLAGLSFGVFLLESFVAELGDTPFYLRDQTYEETQILIYKKNKYIWALLQIHFTTSENLDICSNVINCCLYWLILLSSP